MNCNLSLAVLALALLTLTGCAVHNPNAFWWLPS
jgi:hypothetical protein